MMNIPQEFEDVFQGVELTEDEIRTLNWIVGWESRTVENLRSAIQKVRAELEKVKRALAMMWFAYVNSDKESPHSYETEALEEAECLLGPWEECMPKFLRCGQKED